MRIKKGAVYADCQHVLIRLMQDRQAQPWQSQLNV